MKRTEHKQESIFGTLINFITYETTTPSPYWVIFYHGLGEKGAADGSQITLLEKIGPLKHAKAGFEYPFNLIAAQAVTSHTFCIKYLPAFITLKYKAKVVIVTGLSMGGFATFDTPPKDELGLVRAIAPVCGAKSFTAESVAAYPNVIGWAFHGENDSTVRYTRSKAFVDAYNDTHGEPDFKYTLYPGIGHNAWDKAYSVTAGQDELLQWMIQQFNEAPKETLPGFDVEAFRNTIRERVTEAINTA